MNNYIKKGIDKFYAKNFTEAMLNFSLALSLDPSSKQSRIGAILCDMAVENEEQAMALFEYYLLTKANVRKIVKKLSKKSFIQLTITWEK